MFPRLKQYIKPFALLYFPILINFIGARIIVQTDLLFASHLGTVETAVLGIPWRIMIVDFMVAIAIGPALAIALAKVADKDKSAFVSQAIWGTAWIGAILTLLGILLYPLIVTNLELSPEVAASAKHATLIMTISIPIRITFFVITMLAFTLNKGKQVTQITLLSIFLNGTLNALFVIFLQQGIWGIYTSTIAVTTLELICGIWIMRRYLSFSYRFQFQWWRRILHSIGAEFIRVAAWSLLGFIMLALVSLKTHSTDLLAVFHVVMEVQVLLLMPLVAFMRALSIFIGKLSIDILTIYNKLLWPVVVMAFCILGFSLSIYYLGADYIGHYYLLNEQQWLWWQPFIHVMAFFMPVYFIKMVQFGIWQAYQKFTYLCFYEVMCYWLIGLTIFYFSLQHNIYYMVWLALPIADLVVNLILWLHIKLTAAPLSIQKQAL